MHVGGESARELGPWSSAYDLADGQRAAIQRREEQILARRRASDAEKAEAESAWKPHALPGKTASQLASVRPLAELALDTVVTLMEDVESLEGLPEAVTVRISGTIKSCRGCCSADHAAEWSVKSVTVPSRVD